MWITISMEGVKQDQDLISRQLALTQHSIQKAEARAVNKTARWLRTQVLRQVSRAVRIPQKALKSRFLIPKKANRTETRATFWAGMYGIDPLWLGAGRRTKTGYRVGRRQFVGGFRATMRSGHTGVFRREGRERLPIIQEYITINTETEEAVRRLIPRAEHELIKKLKQEINYELHKTAGSAR